MSQKVSALVSRTVSEILKKVSRSCLKSEPKPLKSEPNPTQVEKCYGTLCTLVLVQKRGKSEEPYVPSDTGACPCLNYTQTVATLFMITAVCFAGAIFVRGT